VLSQQIDSLVLNRNTEPEEFDRYVIEKVARLGGLTLGCVLPGWSASTPADDFWNSLNLSVDEKKRIRAKMFPKRLGSHGAASQPGNRRSHQPSGRGRALRPARRASPEETSSGALHALLGQADRTQLHDKEPLQLNPAPSPTDEQTLIDATKGKAKEAAPVERPTAQPAKKRGNTNPNSDTRPRLNEYALLRAEGYTRGGAIDAMVDKTPPNKKATERFAIRRAVRLYLDGEDWDWAAVKF
jgi:hypothetical protein